MIVVATLIGCAGEDIAQTSGTQSNGKGTVHIVTFTSEGPAVQADGMTRSSITHTQGQGATPYWSAGDKVWVKATDGAFKQSGAGVFNTDMTHGVFSLSGTFANGCMVNYTGANAASGDKVTIAKEQKQAKPNDFSHAGASGDCGTAKAEGDGQSFKFKLDHKAAYLCFLPYTSNDFIKRSKLIKIEVASKDAIAGTYDFSDGSLSSAPVEGASTTITLTTGDGFAVTNAEADAAANGAYMVIAPGKHDLVVRYWFRNTTDSPKEKVGGNIVYNELEGTITKNFTIDCVAGKIYDITAKMEVEEIADKYYMWDAYQNYWYTYENEQPKINGESNANYPKDGPTVNTNRWYNTPDNHWAERSAAKCANVNLMGWMVWKGDPHWDNELWSLMGYLYQGRMWIKKLSTIAAENRTTVDAMEQKSSDNVDYRFVSVYKDELLNRTISRDPLFKDDLTKYFNLKPCGRFVNGKLDEVGKSALYWSKTRTLKFGANDLAYCFNINPGQVSVGYNSRTYGMQLFTEGYK